ncbi:hypothetical protein [Micromonospora sp. NPDC005087]|uniref:hypothetical protein n=1 Tax=Micromonospora sp. NPDC005087 TaxID=3364225 RepID=UPI0036A18A41
MTDRFQSPPIAAGGFFRGTELTASLPGRHVPLDVYAAAERFARACAAVRRADAEIAAAGTAMRDVENRVMAEAYRAVSEDAVIDEDAKLAQSDDWAAAKTAEETARARFDGAKEAMAQMHAGLVAVADSGEWGEYLVEQRQGLSGRLVECLSGAVELLEELYEVEGLSALVAAGGVSRKRRGQAVAPVESESTELIRNAQELLRRLLAPEVKAVRKLSVQQEWVRSDASDKTFAPVAFEEQA